MNRSQSAYYRRQRMFCCYVRSLAALALSIILMPIVYYLRNTTRIPMYIVAVLFWMALFLTIRMAVNINNSRRRNSAFNKKYKTLKKLALIHFFQNKMALIMDSIMFVSLIAFVVMHFITDNLVIHFLFVSMFAFSFGMHCMLNGINYIYINHKSTVRRY